MILVLASYRLVVVKSWINNQLQGRFICSFLDVHDPTFLVPSPDLSRSKPQHFYAHCYKSIF